MRRLALILLAALLLAVPAAPAAAAVPEKLVEVTFPSLSKQGNLDFWKIPWVAGDKLNGSIQVKVNAKVKGLTLRAASSAVTLDPDSRRVIPKSKILFTAADTTATDKPVAADAIQEPGNYQFDFTADGIPGEDVYLAELEAAGEAYDEATQKWSPFVQKLPNIKLKAFAEPAVRIVTGKQLTAQWTNLNAPFNFLAPLERFLDRTPEMFWSHYNPPPTVAVTLPGRPNVYSTQTYQLDVTLDPVLDQDNNETQWIHFWIDGGENHDSPTGVVAKTSQTFEGNANEIVNVEIFRDNQLKPDGTIWAHRIPPGIYRTTLHIHTEWGTVHDLPVEVKVRDAAPWPLMALVVGIVISLLSTYWQRRQPLYRAQVRCRRWRAYYMRQGLRLALAERTMEQLNGSVIARDGAGATRAADFLEDLMRNQPDALTLDAAIAELSGMEGVNLPQLWAQVISAASVIGAYDLLENYCAGHPSPAVKDFGSQIAANRWHPRTAPPALEELTTAEGVRRRVNLTLSDVFAGLRRSVTRVIAPGFWDTTTMLVLFLLVNGGLIALQLAQSYGPNATFGSATDYMNLLFWGFAGDTTRTKLTDLAAQVMPTDKPGAAAAAPTPTTPQAPGAGSTGASPLPDRAAPPRP